MELPRIEIYAVKPLGRKSYSAYYKEDGRKVVLKPKADFSDKQVIRYLFEIKMQGIPYILGETIYQSTLCLVFSSLSGQRLDQAELEPDKAHLIIKKVLNLINKLSLVTGMNWFFLDLKPQHILLEKTGAVSLIDFEHVIVNKEKKVNWQEYKQIGVTPHYCSSEIKQTFLTKNHHEHALALIYLSLLINKTVEELNSRNRKKAIKKIAKKLDLNIESALNGQGFIPVNESKLYQDLKLEIKPQEFSESSQILPTVIPEKTEKTEKIEKSKLEKINLPSNLIQQDVNQHCIFIGQNQNDEIVYQEELKIITEMKFLAQCNCHSLPIIASINLAYVEQKDQELSASIILQEINKFFSKEQEPNLLTKKLTNHIVRQCGINDLFISAKHNCICKIITDGDLSLNWQIQETHYGKFSTEPELIHRLINFNQFRK